MDCCAEGAAYDAEFSRGYAQATARRYLRRGLPPVAARMVDFVQARGLEGATVLEVGGGVGYLCLDLVRRGAAAATNLDLSPNYEQDARELARRYGLEDRLTLLRLDIARHPGAVGPADVVVLNRVVCCYPDHPGLLSAASSHARSLLVLSYPTVNPLTRAFLGLGNWANAVRSRQFRAHLHDPGAMIAVCQSNGLRLAMEHRGPLWSIAGFERRAA